MPLGNKALEVNPQIPEGYYVHALARVKTGNVSGAKQDMTKYDQLKKK